MKCALFNICFLFFSTISNAQLFPKLPELKGNISSIVETHHNGHEKSGSWKYYYTYINNNRKTQQVNKFKGRVRANNSYAYDTSNFRLFEREIFNHKKGKKKGNYHEAEYILDSSGQITRCNIWFCNSNTLKRKLSVVEKNVKYDSLARMISFERNTFYKINEETSNQIYIFQYDSLSRLSIIEAKDLYTTYQPIKDTEDSSMWRFKEVKITEPELRALWKFEYNENNLLITYTYQVHGRSQKLKAFKKDEMKLFYDYDLNGNWITCFRQFGEHKKQLYIERNIRYLQ